MFFFFLGRGVPGKEAEERVPVFPMATGGPMEWFLQSLSRTCYLSCNQNSGRKVKGKFPQNISAVSALSIVYAVLVDPSEITRYLL